MYSNHFGQRVFLDFFGMFLWCPDFGGKWGRPRQSFYLRGAKGSHMMDRNRARAEDQTWYECDIAICELRTSTCFMHDWLISTREIQPKGRKGLKTECKWWSEEGVLSIHRIPFVCGMRQTSTTMMIGKRKNTLVRHQIRRMESWRITQFQIANWSFSPPKLTFDAMILDQVHAMPCQPLKAVRRRNFRALEHLLRRGEALGWSSFPEISPEHSFLACVKNRDRTKKFETCLDVGDCRFSTACKLQPLDGIFWANKCWRYLDFLSKYTMHTLSTHKLCYWKALIWLPTKDSLQYTSHRLAWVKANWFRAERLAITVNIDTRYGQIRWLPIRLTIGET